MRSDCPLAPTCYRFLAVPSRRQSYAMFKPEGCDSFWAKADASGPVRSFAEAREQIVEWELLRDAGGGSGKR
jgi:hypothetical protein